MTNQMDIEDTVSEMRLSLSPEFSLEVQKELRFLILRETSALYRLLVLIETTPIDTPF